MDAPETHEDRWRQLLREVIRDLEEEVERLRIEASDTRQTAQEREMYLLELLDAERASRLPAPSDGAMADAPQQREGGRTVVASARIAELMRRLSPRIPELEAALKAREEELAAMRNRRVLRAIDTLVKLKRRVMGGG
jgi:hypothetical protein